MAPRIRVVIKISTPTEVDARTDAEAMYVIIRARSSIMWRASEAKATEAENANLLVPFAIHGDLTKHENALETPRK